MRKNGDRTVSMRQLQCSSQQHTLGMLRFSEAPGIAEGNVRAKRVMTEPSRTATIQAAPLEMPLSGARHSGAGGVRKETKKNAMALKPALSRGKRQPSLVMCW